MSDLLNKVRNISKELPNNIEAEQSIIGSILISNELFDEINMIIYSKIFTTLCTKKSMLQWKN